MDERPDEPAPPVEVSAVQTAEGSAREARVLVTEIEAQPGYWSGFVRRRILLVAVAAAALVVVAVVARPTAGGLLRGGLLLALVVVGAVAFDLWQVRRALRRSIRTYTGGAVGTPITARYSPHRVSFVLPTHEVAFDPRTFTAGRYRDGVLVLDLEDSPRVLVVSDDLLGDGGLAVLRTALGDRLVET